MIFWLFFGDSVASNGLSCDRTCKKQNRSCINSFKIVNFRSLLELFWSSNVFLIFFSEKGRRLIGNGKNFRPGAQTRSLICKVTMLGEINRKFPTQLDTLLRKKIICQYALCKPLSGGLWSFKLAVTKLARFYSKNKYAWRQFMHFVNWHGAGSTKLGLILETRLLLNSKFTKVITIVCSPKPILM